LIKSKRIPINRKTCEGIGSDFSWLMIKPNSSVRVDSQEWYRRAEASLGLAEFQSSK
jgi:hypothetical protein